MVRSRSSSSSSSFYYPNKTSISKPSRSRSTCCVFRQPPSIWATTLPTDLRSIYPPVGDLKRDRMNRGLHRVIHFVHSHRLTRKSRWVRTGVSKRALERLDRARRIHNGLLQAASNMDLVLVKRPLRVSSVTRPRLFDQKAFGGMGYQIKVSTSLFSSAS